MKSPQASRIVWEKTHENIFDAPESVWDAAYAEAKE